MRRIDALVDDPRRLSVVAGDLLASAEDPELQALVREAADVAGVPMAAVSLVLERTQLFRAQVGLPADLAAILATDRDASFCQFAVRDRAPFTVTDARYDARVPTELVEQYGIAAYHGAPIFVRDQPLGTLCVIDVEARDFDPRQQTAIAAIATRVSARLEVLAASRSRDALGRTGLRPAFASMRNLLMPLESNLAMAQVAVAEARVAFRLLAHVAAHGQVPAVASLTGAVHALDDLEPSLADAATSAAELREVVLALQAAVISSLAPTAIGAIVTAADALAQHETKLTGGVRRHEGATDPQVSAATTIVVSLVAAALGELSRAISGRAGSGGVDLVVRVADGEVELRITAPDLAPEPETEVAARLRELAWTEPGVTIAALAGGVAITLLTA